ncbi:MAG: ABC transporter permease [Gemmatimonadales bacterium]
METLLQDIRYAVRTLGRAPGMAALAVLCMGLGIGAVTTMYSTARAFTLRPLPQIHDAGRLMHVWEGPADAPDRFSEVAPAALRDLQGLREFSAVAAMAGLTLNVTGGDVPERVRAARVSFNFLQAMGRRPLLGRDFTAADDASGEGRVALLGFGLWQRRFGGDSALVGRTVQLDGVAYRVVGILPDDFVFPAAAQLLTPLALTPEAWAARRDRNLFALARLAPGVGARQAEVAVAALGARLSAAYPEASDHWVMRAELAESLFGRGPRPFMMVLLASVGFVLLIACANVANLLLARATGRRREIALRVALGASRARVVRQLLTESVLIALAGAALGVLVALWGLDATAASVPVEVRVFIPGFGMMHLEPSALGVAVLAAVGSGVLFGLAPALAAVRTDVQQSLKDGARGDIPGGGVRKLRSGLVVAEVALALVLLVGATLMISTFRKLALTDPGFRAAGVITLGVTLPAADYPRDSTVTAFYHSLEERVAAIPGVEAAGETTVLPMSWEEDRTAVEVEGRPPRRPEDAPRAGIRIVSPGYLGVLGVALRKGRGFAREDNAAAPLVAVVSEAAARMLWPGEDPIGKRIKVRSAQWTQVVGVVSDVRGNVLVADDPRQVLYVPYPQMPARSMIVVARTAGDPAALAPQVQREITALDSRLAAGDVAPMRRVILSALSPQSATAGMLAAAALVALFMAAAGTYGVMAYAVAQRTQEIGVRVALGATPAAILRLVLGQGLSLAGAGLVLGVVGALAMGRGMRAILAGTDASDPVTIGGVALLLGTVALVASWVPARRAARVDPMVALRSD